ncbi:hypothetical protein E4U43_000753 [Claviceps pusilla]|uniref:Heterokaryon incompatibility domain-containing protein n=1 Tax=Claviceps pusilla TaxID=123648 RepID=A0A9P7NB09_9HYPO|nr:hypothetical protein E4U43_000753 [Claviceps pusilla]
MPEVSDLSTPSPSPPRERDRARDRARDRPRERTQDRNISRERNQDRDRDRDRDPHRDRDFGRNRERQRDYDRDRETDRDSTLRNKRLSITERIRGTFGQARKETAAAVQRRASTSATYAARKSPIPLIREWLDTCNTEHGTHCADHDEVDAPTWGPVFLIDCVERCLVHAKPTDRYATLSYDEGSSNPRHSRPEGPQAQLLKSNVDAYQLSLPDNDVSQTILDAIWLTKKLGIRHLWVDGLCVVQDDEKDKMEHIVHMAYILSNAYLGIIVAYGDVNTGILPLDPRRPIRNPKQGSQEHSELLQASKWNTRVWALQERIYSRRTVFFFEDTITWKCHCDLWQGDTTNMMKILKGKKPICTHGLSESVFAYRHSPWPDMDEYARLVMDYSVKRVRLVDDTLMAFAGITHVLSRTFQGGFVYGLPLMFIDIALLWRPQATIRRRPSSRPICLPSWSWMGWWTDGVPLDLVLWRAAADYVQATRSTTTTITTTKTERGPDSKRFQGTHHFRIKATVIWNLSDGVKSMPIKNTGLQLREFRSRRSSASGLPRGWTRSGNHFRHDCDEFTTFKYPIPIEDVPKGTSAAAFDSRPSPTELDLPGPLLFFKTTSGFFEVDYAISVSPRDKASLPIAIGNIWSKSGRWIGEFRAHDGWLGIQSSNYDGEEKLEFIAISSAMERKGSYVFPMDRFEENMDEDGVVHFINVLWVERISGVAFRRGIGHVLQKAWDTDARDEVDIYLG